MLFKNITSGIWFIKNDRVKHFFLLSSANVALLLSTISDKDAKMGYWNKADLRKGMVIPMSLSCNHRYLPGYLHIMQSVAHKFL